MTAFFDLSPVARALFAIWAMTICLSGIVGAVHACRQKRYRAAACTLLFIAPAWFLYEVIHDIYIEHRLGKGTAFSLMLGEQKMSRWLIVFGVLTVLALIILIRIKLIGVRIARSSIKLCADSMPCGICYYRDNGRVVLANICMKNLCVAVTQNQLLNAKIFRDALGGSVCDIGGRVWQFKFRDIEFDGAPLHEMIAADITDEYEKAALLREENAKLAELNRELEEYNLSIDDTVRRQEILQAKVSIHDEMNRLMLSTAAVDAEDTEALDRCFARWEKNALLLCMEAEGRDLGNVVDRLEKLADVLGIELLWSGEMPEVPSKKQRELFMTAAQEAIANAVKHAGAKRLEISFTETDKKIRCEFTNAGSFPKAEVRFAGGLANLARYAREQGAEISAEAGEKFRLVLDFPK